MEGENLGSRLPLKNDYCFSNVILFVQFLHKKKKIYIYSDEKLINTFKLDKTSVLY